MIAASTIKTDFQDMSLYFPEAYADASLEKTESFSFAVDTETDFQSTLVSLLPKRPTNNAIRPGLPANRAAFERAISKNGFFKT